MSGVEVKRKLKETQMNMCGSCMNSIVQTFDHLKEQILMLNNEKINLLMELKKSKEQQEKQKQVMLKDIKVLKQQLASLKKTT